jgi:hypothetical protein
MAISPKSPTAFTAFQLFQAELTHAEKQYQAVMCDLV